MPDELVLYGNDRFTSPYVFSAFVTLKEKGVPFRLELLSLERKEHERPEYAGPSLTGKVPALRHGDFWLAESSAIDEYVDEAFPPPAHPRLYPEDARGRARVRMVQAFLRSDLAPLRSARPTATFFHGEPVAPLGPEARAAAERLFRVAERVLPPGASVRRRDVLARGRGPRAHAPAARRERRSVPAAARGLRARRLRAALGPRVARAHRVAGPLNGRGSYRPAGSSRYRSRFQ